MDYITIHKFMLKELDLNRTELLVFAAIYAFTSGEKGGFCASREYLADAIGGCVRAVANALRELVKKELIVKAKHFGPAGYCYTVADRYKNRHWNDKGNQEVEMNGKFGVSSKKTASNLRLQPCDGMSAVENPTSSDLVGVHEMPTDDKAQNAYQEGTKCLGGGHNCVKNEAQNAYNNKYNKYDNKMIYISKKDKNEYGKKGTYNYSELPEAMRRNAEERAIEEIKRRREQQMNAEYADEMFIGALRRSYGERADSMISDFKKINESGVNSYRVAKKQTYE